MNLQRGMWRNDTQNDFLGYDPPSPTVYTGMTSKYYCIWFVIIVTTHVLSIMAMKSKLSPDFQKLNFLDKFLHAAVSTNFPYAVNDWDLKKVEGPLSEYREGMENVRTEVVWNICINLIFNICLLAPLEHLCKYYKYIHLV